MEMKSIVVRESNIYEMNEAIKKAEGRARERLLTAKDVIAEVERIKAKFKSLGVRIKELNGCTFVVDSNGGESYARCYRGQPQSTWYELEMAKGIMRLVKVWRADTSKYVDETSALASVTYTEEAKEAIWYRLGYM